MGTTKREIIKKSSMFRTLTHSQLAKLVDICQEKSYEAGASIFREGESAASLHIVAEGKVALEMEIRIGSRTRKQATIDVTSRGQVLGWSALLERPVHTMSAVAIENTRLLAFSGKTLRHLCDEDDDLCRKVMNEIANLISDRLSNARQTLAYILSVTSHDLRAPLATVQSSLDVVIGGFVGDINTKQRDLLMGSKQRLSDLTNMIDNILDISHIEISATDFEEVSLPDLIASCLDDVQGLAQQKGVNLENNAPTELSRIVGLPKRLRQVLNNLFTNAIKFTPAGGTVSIDTEETKNYVLTKVSDTGIGISREELPKIFDDFYRGVRVDAEGVGLGLGIAKRIIEAHRGLIYVESPCPETGVGTKFSFTLPRVSVARIEEAEEEARPVKKARVVVADDDPQMLKVTTLLLESRGYQVFGARDGVEALAKVEEVKPDLLILDFLMPRMDGFEVIKRLDERAYRDENDMAIVILSAIREGDSLRRYELETKTKFRADDYIEKPIAPPVLLQRLEKVLMGRKVRE